MRLRQLLSVFLALIASGVVAAAMTSELKNVTVASQGNSTTVTLLTSGAFGHNEYKASENLFLIDLTGVSAGKLKDTKRNVQATLIESYHVVEYQGMGGKDVARVEVQIAAGSEWKIAETPRGLTITFFGKGETPSAAVESAPKALASVRNGKPGVKTPVAAGVVKVQHVSVVRGKDGVDVEVSGTGAMTANVLKLSSPDRIVLDIPNSQPIGHPPVVGVNGRDIKSIRTSRYQADPPMTRVVVDLTAPHDYNLSASGNKLVLKLHGGEASAETSAAPTTAPIIRRPTPLAPIVQSAGLTETKAAGPAKSDPLPPAANETSAPKPEAAIETASAQSVKENKEPKGGSETPEAKPVVFVEPKYQTKQPDNGDPSTAADKKAIQATPAVQTAALQQPNALTTQGSSQPAASQPIQGAVPASKPLYTGEPISVNLKDVDLKDFFRLIHEISGLNVVLDPGVNGSLTLVLEDVPWDQALDIVLKNNSLDKQLDGNVLRIATIENLRKEAQSKRLQLEAEALAVPKVSVTRFLSYARAKDILPTAKKLLSSRGDIVADDRMNALIVQDIPNIIPDLDRLIAQLDRKTQEVDIEARVVAATRSFKRDIGAMLAAGWGNGVSAVGGSPNIGASPLGAIAPNPKYFISQAGGSGSSGGGVQQIPLISSLLPTKATSGISFLNATSNYRLDIMLAAAEKRGLLKILSRPHIVTQNNIQAFVKQGMRIPITTQAQLNGPPTVQYVEAVLRLQVTPQITTDNTIFLNVEIENTQPDFSNMVQGNPVFLTQQATTQVLVSDGGTVMIGGVIQTQNSVTSEIVPFVGNVPILGNLFKHKIVDNSTQELIFIITPKIVQT